MFADSLGFEVPRYVAGALYGALGIFAIVQFIRLSWHIRKYKLPTTVLVRRRLLCTFSGGASLSMLLLSMLLELIYSAWHVVYDRSSDSCISIVGLALLGIFAQYSSISILCYNIYTSIRTIVRGHLSIF